MSGLSRYVLSCFMVFSASLGLQTCGSPKVFPITGLFIMGLLSKASDSMSTSSGAWEIPLPATVSDSSKM